MLLAKLADIQMGYAFRSRLEHDPAGNVAVIQMSDIDDDDLLHEAGAMRIAFPEDKKHHLLQPGDILFRSRGRSNGAAIVTSTVGHAILSAPLLLIRSHGVLPEYLLWYLNTPHMQRQFGALSEGTSVRMISAEALKSLDVPLPPTHTQQHIAEVATLARREQQLLARTSALQHSLTTHRLLTLAQGMHQ